MHVPVGVEHLHLLIETAKMETTSLEGNDQLEQGKAPIDRIRAEKRARRLLTDEKRSCTMSGAVPEAGCM